MSFSSLERRYLGVDYLLLVGKMGGEVRKCVLTAILNITAEKAFVIRYSIQKNVQTVAAI